MESFIHRASAPADAFDCANCSRQRNTTSPTPNTGLCEVFSCIGYLCDAHKAIPDFVEDCSTAYNNCLSFVHHSLDFVKPLYVSGNCLAVLLMEHSRGSVI